MFKVQYSDNLYTYLRPHQKLLNFKNINFMDNYGDYIIWIGTYSTRYMSFKQFEYALNT